MFKTETYSAGDSSVEIHKVTPDDKLTDDNGEPAGYPYVETTSGPYRVQDGDVLVQNGNYWDVMPESAFADTDYSPASNNASAVAPVDTDAIVAQVKTELASGNDNLDARVKQLETRVAELEGKVSNGG